MDPMDGVDTSSEVGIAIRQFSHSVDALRGAFEWLGRTGIIWNFTSRFCMWYPTFRLGAFLEDVEMVGRICFLFHLFWTGGLHQWSRVDCRYLCATRHPPGRNLQSVHNEVWPTRERCACSSGLTVLRHLLMRLWANLSKANPNNAARFPTSRGTINTSCPVHPIWRLVLESYIKKLYQTVQRLKHIGTISVKFALSLWSLFARSEVLGWCNGQPFRDQV